VDGGQEAAVLERCHVVMGEYALLHTQELFELTLLKLYACRVCMLRY
jgi:hypothetical protein